MSPSLLATAAALVALAAFVQGAMGFGFGLVAMATLPLLLGVKATVPVVAGFGILLNILLLSQLRDALSGARIGPLILGGVVGTPIGVTFLKQADPALLLSVLGVMLVVFAAWLGRKGAVADRPAGWGVLAGVISGMMGGAFNTGGPPVVAYTSSKPWTPREIRATLQGFFFLQGSLQLTLFALNGMLTRDSLWTNAVLLPALAVGALAGDRLSDRLPPAQFRLLIRVGLAILGVVMLARTLA